LLLFFLPLVLGLLSFPTPRGDALDRYDAAGAGIERRDEAEKREKERRK
jgi:hypothetical protein